MSCGSTVDVRKRTVNKPIQGWTQRFGARHGNITDEKVAYKTMFVVCEMNHSISRFRRIGTREAILGSAHLLKHTGGVLYETVKLPVKGIAGAAGAVYDTAKHGVCPPCESPPPPEVSPPSPPKQKMTHEGPDTGHHADRE